MYLHVLQFGEHGKHSSDASNVSSGHCDFMAMFDIGIRCPKWVMPYFAVGINGTFSLYPDNIKNVDAFYNSETSEYECWRNPDAQVRYADLEKNLMISLGAHAKVGLDVKFKRFSVGFYCLYLIKDIIKLILISTKITERLIKQIFMLMAYH